MLKLDRKSLSFLLAIELIAGTGLAWPSTGSIRLAQYLASLWPLPLFDLVHGIGQDWEVSLGRYNSIKMIEAMTGKVPIKSY